MLVPRMFGENMFDDWFGFPFFEERNHRRGGKPAESGKELKGLMATDIKEQEGGYELSIDLPGFSKEDVKAELENGYLTIVAERKSEDEETDPQTGRYIRKERFEGRCRRMFYVGEDVTEEDIKGKFEQGTLTLFVPKKETKPAVEQKKYIAIEG